MAFVLLCVWVRMRKAHKERVAREEDLDLVSNVSANHEHAMLSWTHIERNVGNVNPHILLFH